jgi:hypothetical protein
LQVSGRASDAQVGLIGCYLRALAHRSLNELAPLTSVVPDTPVTLTMADLRHASDANSGTARAVFSINPSDAFNGGATIHFADGASESVGMDALNVMAPASRSWRLHIGKWPPDPSAPPSAARGSGG